MEYLLVALVGYGLYDYFNAAKKFLTVYKVKFLDAKFDYQATAGSSFQTTFFKIKIRVANDTDFSGTLNTAKISVYYGAKKLAYVDAKNAITIQANKETIVEIPVRVSTFAFIRSIPELLQIVASGKTLSLHLKGDLNFAAGTYTVDQDIKVPLLKQ